MCKAAIFVDFIGTNLSGIIKINAKGYAGPWAETCIKFWHLSPGTQSEKPGYIYI